MTDTKYRMSFSTGGLFLRESVILAQEYFVEKDWKKVRERVFNQNLLQVRTQSTLKRIYREISQRLKTLTEEQLQILADGIRQEQSCLLWLAVCKRYSFIYEFAVEVIREKYLGLDFKVSPVDFDIFFNRKAEWHEELEDLTDKTVNKLKQILFRIMHEADILTGENMINQVMFTPRFINAVKNDNIQNFLIFPVSDFDIKKWITNE